MSEIHLRKYGVQTTVDFDLFEVDGVDFRVDAVHASGDTVIMKDEGAEANTTNGFTDEGTGYSIVLTATEMQAARIVVYVVDQTATKVWLDRKIIIETYGNASAMHAMDFDEADGSQFTEAGGTGDHLTAIDLPNQTMDITGNLSGSVGSVTGAVGSVTGAVGSVTGHTAQTGDTYGALGATALAAMKAVWEYTSYGTLSGTHSSTTADLGTNAPTQDIAGQTLWFPDDDLTRIVSSYNTGTGVATWVDAVTPTLTNGDNWVLIPTAPSSVESKIDIIDTNVDTILVDTADMQPKLGTPAGADMSADIAAVKADTAATLVDTGTTIPATLTDMAGATFATGTDSLEAIRNRGDAAWTTGGGGSNPTILQNTTIATLASQTSFTLTAGSADDDAYNGCIVIVEDSATATQKAVGYVSDYTGSTKTVTLKADPGVFTMAIGDTIDVVAWPIQQGVDAVWISGDSTAADNLELQYDTTGLTGDTFPSTQLQIGQIAVGSGGVSVVAESFTKSGAEPETNTYTSTHEDDGTYHIVEDVTNNTDAYYTFDVGGNGVPQSFTWNGYAQGNNDSYAIYAYNWGGVAYEQIGTITGAAGTAESTESFDCTTAHVGTGANLGKVRFRFLSTDGSAFATDRLLCTYAVVAQSVGYADGAIWVDTNNGTAGTEVYVNGTADNPVDTWADALTLNTSLGTLNRFRVKGSITLSANSDGYAILSGDGLYTLALGTQSAANIYVVGASISGTSTGTGQIYEDCEITAGTSTGPAKFVRCGVNTTTGSKYSSNGTGEYVLVDCYSLVAGSGSPCFDFSGEAGTSGVNIRRFAGGTDITLDSNNSLSLEVLGGGGQTITTGGADCEIRGIMRALTVTMSSTETVQYSGVCGPIAVSGTTTGTVNLYGVSSSVTDTTSGATTTDSTVNRANINTEVDTGISDASLATAAALATVDTNVDAVLVDTGTTLPATLTTIEGKIDTVDTNVDAVLVDTGTTLPATLGTPAGADMAADIAAVKVDTAATLVDTGTTLPATLTTIEGKVDTVDTVVDAIKVVTDALGATAAAKLALSMIGTASGAAIAGTLSTTQMTTDLTETTDDHFIGRTIVWTSGALALQASNCTDYDGTTKRLDYATTTDAPSATDTFVIV